MKLAVTGATGQIGSRLCKIAVEQGYDVTAIMRKNSSNFSKLTGIPVNIVECNAEEYANFETDIKSDCFIHLAWDGRKGKRDDTYVQAKNIENTLGAVDLANKMNCSSFIFATSQSEIGVVNDVITSNTPCFPVRGDGIAKLAAGSLSLLRCSQLGIRHSRARILSIFGEGDDDERILTYTAKTLKKGEKPLLTKCEQMWDFIYIDEAVRQILSIAAKGKDIAIYQVCSGKEKPMKWYIEQIRDMIDPSLPLGFGERDYYPGQPMRLCGDLEQLIKDTGYTPVNETVEESLRLFLMRLNVLPAS